MQLLIEEIYVLKKCLFRLLLLFWLIIDEILNFVLGKLQLNSFTFDIYIYSGTRTPILVEFEQLLDVLEWAISEKNFISVYFVYFDYKPTKFWFFVGKLQLLVLTFQIYIHRGTRAPILVGFEQLLDVLKWAISEKKVYSVYFVYFDYKPTTFWFFCRQATAKWFSFLNSTYMVGLVHQFWLNLNHSLAF